MSCPFVDTLPSLLDLATILCESVCCEVELRDVKTIVATYCRWCRRCIISQIIDPPRELV